MAATDIDHGHFMVFAYCRCAKCDRATNVEVEGPLERVGNSLDANVPGDFVAMTVRDIQFPVGWTMGADLKPRCPEHGEEADADPS